MKSTAMVETYFRRDGTPKKMGDTVKRPRLAWTLQKIAKHGPAIFYNVRTHSNHQPRREILMAAVIGRDWRAPCADRAGK